jgi:hypothetical protein
MLSAIIIEDEKLAREVLISLLEQFFGNKINYDFNLPILDFNPYIFIWEKANSWEKSISAR